MSDIVEITIVMPCLNEADTVAACIRKAQLGLERAGIKGEILIADNGSTDGSIDIAEKLGARVVPVKLKGYGNALKGGIEAARANWIIMGDADDSYDFSEIEGFVKKLREGNDLVMGCRLTGGGGKVMPGAMPWSHRWIGNPMFSRMVRVMFGSPIHDVYCGLRGFRKDWYEKLDMRCTGMEFATEMIIKASLFPSKIAEVPTTLHPDGRVTQRPHLRTVRDGWRTLRFFLMYSPRWLFLYPGLLLIFLGVVGYALALPGMTVFGATLDAHTLLIASLAILIGHQSALFALFTRTFAVSEGLMPPHARLKRWERFLNLERGLMAGVGAVCLGTTLLGLAVREWWLVDFGNLHYAHTMRRVIPGVTLVALGSQTVLGSFFLNILRLSRK